MPTRKTTKTDEAKPYLTAALVVLPFGALTSVLGTVVVKPANARLMLLGYLVTLATLILIITSMRGAKKASKKK